MNRSRRDFLLRSGSALSMSALASQLDYFGLVNTLAQKVDRKEKDEGAVPSDYRALVCIFFSGGNDGNNTVVPRHNDSSVSNYAAYSTARSSQGLAIAQAALLPINVPVIGNLEYGLHPALGTITGGVNPGIHPLWADGKMAIVSNIGTLVRPLTRGDYQAHPEWRPRQLFSHTDQTNQHQNARADVIMLSGWGGRISDKMTLTANPTRLIPTVNSIAGTRLFTVGESTQPLAVSPAPATLGSVLAMTGNDGTPASNARIQALKDALNIDRGNDIVVASQELHREAIRISESLSNSPEVTVVFPNTEIGNQLKQVARMIKNRVGFGLNRQIFFCSDGGFDTHTGQINGQNTLLGRFSQASRSFYDEMVAQGLTDKVTLFTMSDFSRTFNPGGSGGNVGSDHAWANHSFVIGGSVVGGNFYGIPTSNGTPFPTLVLNGPDDADSSSTARGRWIPTTSVEQYAGTISKWFGLEINDMAYVFPNLGNFPLNDLGFMTP